MAVLTAEIREKMGVTLPFISFDLKNISIFTKIQKDWFKNRVFHEHLDQ